MVAMLATAEKLSSKQVALAVYNDILSEDPAYDYDLNTAGEYAPALSSLAACRAGSTLEETRMIDRISRKYGGNPHDRNPPLKVLGTLQEEQPRPAVIDFAFRAGLTAASEPEPRPPMLPVFNQKAQAATCTGSPVIGVVEALQNAASGADRWERKNDRAPFYDYHRNGLVRIEYGRKDEKTVFLEVTKTAQLWRDLQQVTDLEADVFLYIIAQAVHANGGGAWFWPAQFLDYRGVRQKTTRDGARMRAAGHHSDDIERVKEALYRLDELWLTVEEVYQPRGKGKKPRKFVHHGRALAIMETWVQETLTRDEDGLPVRVPVAWRIQVGEWLINYLDAPRMVAYLAQKSLQYDPYREQWEKRLSRYFMFHARINAKHHNVVLPRHVSMLIDDLSLPLDDRNPDRTRARFEKAMDRLKADGHINDWRYKEAPALPAKRWLDAWLDWMVVVEIYAPPALSATPEQ